MTYRRGKAPKCEGPADTWGEKMMARVKEFRAYQAVKEEPIFHLVVMPIALSFCVAFVLFFGSIIASQFRDPILVSPSCSARCQDLGAKKYHVEVNHFVLSRARTLESLCACQFEDGKQMNLIPGEWKSIDE